MLSRPDGGVRTGAGSSSASGGAVSKRTRVFTFLGGMITGAVLMWLAFTTHADWTLNMPQGEAARMSALRSWSKNGGGAHLPPEPIAPPPADGAADTPAASTPSSTQPAAASPPAAPVVVPEVATGDSQMLFDSTKWAPPTEILKARSSLKVPLVCTPTTTMDGRVGWPVGDEAERIQTAAAPPGAITLVLLTAQPEWRRLPLHLTALNIFMEPEHVYEFLIVTTPSLFPEVIEFLRRYESLFRVPIRVVNDGDLIEHSNAWGYYIQMILKMIISTQIKTRFYLVLDTDITMSWPANIRQWIHRADGTDTTQPAGAPMQHSDFVRAAYQEEPRRVHPDWWETTEFALGLQTFSTRSDILQPTRDLPGREAPCLSADPATPTFGVTPALLSTHISQRVLCRLQHLYGSKWLDILVGREYKQFISKPGMWTEYTMYYMTSVCTATLPQYHFAWNITSLPLPPLEPAAWENPKAEENTLRRGLGVGVSLGEAMSRPFPIYPLPSPLPAPMNPLVSPPFHWFANCVWGPDDYRSSTVMEKVRQSLKCGMERRRRMVDADFGAAAAKDGAQGKGKANLEQLWPKLAQQPVSRGLVFTPAPTSLPLVSPSSFSSDFHPCDPAADYSMSNGLPPQFMVLQGRTSEPSPDYTHHQLMPLLLDMLDAEEGARKRLVEQLIKDGSATEEQQAAERRRREAWDEQWKLLNDMRNHQGMKALY